MEADEFWDDEPGPPKADSGVQVRRERARAPFNVIVSAEILWVKELTLEEWTVFDG